MSIVLEVFAKTFDYSGRARRKEFWIYALIQLLVGGVLFAVELELGWFDPELGIGPLTGLVMALTFPTNLALAVRRLHDTGKSGWWYLIVLVPFAGSLILLAFMATDGTHGNNNYGPDPLNRESKGIDPAQI